MRSSQHLAILLGLVLTIVPVFAQTGLRLTTGIWIVRGPGGPYGLMEYTIVPFASDGITEQPQLASRRTEVRLGSPHVGLPVGKWTFLAILVGLLSLLLVAVIIMGVLTRRSFREGVA